jgi:hypothetical protein
VTVSKVETEPSGIEGQESAVDNTSQQMMTVNDFLAMCTDEQLIEVQQQVETDLERYNDYIQSICSRVNPGAETASATLLAEIDTDLRRWMSCICLKSSENSEQWTELGRLMEANRNQHSVDTPLDVAMDAVCTQISSGGIMPLLLTRALQPVRPVISVEDALACIRGEIELDDLKETTVQKGSVRKQWGPPDLQMVFATEEGSGEKDDQSRMQLDDDEQGGWTQNPQPLQVLEKDGSLLRTELTDLPTWAQNCFKPPAPQPVVSVQARKEVASVKEQQIDVNDGQLLMKQMMAKRTATDEVQFKIQLIEDVIVPFASDPAQSGHWMDLCDLTYDLLEETRDGGKHVESLRRSHRQTELLVQEAVNEHRQAISDLRAGTLVGYVPIQEALQLFQEDSSLQLLKQPDIFLQTMEYLGWHDVRAALIDQQEDLRVARKEVIEYACRKLGMTHLLETEKSALPNTAEVATESAAATVTSTTVVTETALIESPTVQDAGTTEVARITRADEMRRSEEVLDNMRPFDGTEDVNLYLFRLEYIAQVYHWTEEDRYVFLAQKLCGAADKVFNGCSKDQQNYAGLTQRLRASFSTAEDPEQARMKLQSRKQHEAETVQELAADIQRLTALGAPNVSYEEREKYLALPAFLDALTNERIRFELRKKQFNTVDEALQEALHLQSWTYLKGGNLTQTSFETRESPSSETDDSGITEPPCRHTLSASESDSGEADRRPAPSVPSDLPSPSSPSEVELLRKEIAELRAENRLLREQVRPKSTTERKVKAENAPSSEVTPSRQQDSLPGSRPRRRRHRRRRRPSSSAKEEQASAVSLSEGSSEFDKRELISKTINRVQLKQKSTAGNSVDTTDSKESDMSTGGLDVPSPKKLGWRRRHHRRRKPSGSDRGPSSSGSEMELYTGMPLRELLCGKQSSDVRPWTPKAGPTPGSPLRAALVSPMQREDDKYRDVCGNEQQTDVRTRTPEDNTLSRPPKSAALPSSPRRGAKDIVIWNASYRPNTDVNDDYCQRDRSPECSVQPNYRQPRRAGFWSYGSDAPSWRARH